MRLNNFDEGEWTRNVVRLESESVGNIPAPAAIVPRVALGRPMGNKSSR